MFVFFHFPTDIFLQLAGKDREIEYLKKDIVEIRRKYEEIYGTKLEDLAEVKVYSGLIMPEIQRMSKYVLVKCWINLFFIHNSGPRTSESTGRKAEQERTVQVLMMSKK